MPQRVDNFFAKLVIHHVVIGLTFLKRKTYWSRLCDISHKERRGTHHSSGSINSVDLPCSSRVESKMLLKEAELMTPPRATDIPSGKSASFPLTGNSLRTPLSPHPSQEQARHPSLILSSHHLNLSPSRTYRILSHHYTVPY
jgi:hypothetical protein